MTNNTMQRISSFFSKHSGLLPTIIALLIPVVMSILALWLDTIIPDGGKIVIGIFSFGIIALLIIGRIIAWRRQKVSTSLASQKNKNYDKKISALSEEIKYNITQITGNKPYFFSCFLPIKHKHKIIMV